MWYVYVLRSLKNGNCYTGFTNDSERRVFEHDNNFKKNFFTYKNRPYKLIRLEKFDSKKEAMRRERFLKTGKGREELENLLFA